MTERGISPSQTVGPFFSFGLTPDKGATFSNDLADTSVAGQRVRIQGRLTDGDGVPIGDAIVEIWQADAEGRYAHPRDPRGGSNSSFTGFGRTAVDGGGEFAFTTIKPGPVPGPGGGDQAPHVSVSIFARGFLNRLHTRIYFADEAANADDPVLALLPDFARDTLIATLDADGVYRFDIRVQGDRETVFFES